MATEPAIELPALGRAYGERTALRRGRGFGRRRGETLAVFGANGAGKTTLLRILATLLRPHAGSARVLGAELPRESWAVRGRLGLLGARPAAVPRPLRAREPALPRPAARRRRRARRASCSTRSACARAPTSRCARSRAAWPSAWRSAARCCTSPSCCCSTSRCAEPRPRRGRAGRAADRALGGRTRVLISHDVERGLAEADDVLGLRGGRAELVAPAAASAPTTCGSCTR